MVLQHGFGQTCTEAFVVIEISTFKHESFPLRRGWREGVGGGDYMQYCTGFSSHKRRNINKHNFLRCSNSLRK